MSDNHNLVHSEHTKNQLVYVLVSGHHWGQTMQQLEGPSVPRKTARNP